MLITSSPLEHSKNFIEQRSGHNLAQCQDREPIAVLWYLLALAISVSLGLPMTMMLVEILGYEDKKQVLDTHSPTEVSISEVSP